MCSHLDNGFGIDYRFILPYIKIYKSLHPDYNIFSSSRLTPQRLYKRLYINKQTLNIYSTYR